MPTATATSSVRASTRCGHRSTARRSMRATRAISRRRPSSSSATKSVAKFADPATLNTATPANTADDTPVAERANYYDVGAQQKSTTRSSPGDDLTLGVDSFLKLSKDLIDEGQFGAPIILTPFNYAHGKQYGVEYSTTYDSGPFSAYANLSFEHAMGKDIFTSQFEFDPGRSRLHPGQLHPPRSRAGRDGVGGRVLSLARYALQRRHASTARACAKTRTAFRTAIICRATSRSISA